MYLLPFAGGTSLSYLSLVDAMKKSMTKNGRNFDLKFCPIDLPGRLLNPSKHGNIIRDVPTLADEVVKSFLHDDISMTSNAGYILFGHSFGAIVAYEIARVIKDLGGTAPLALFVSACRAPSVSLVASKEKPVSEMNMKEVGEYLKGFGSDLSFDEEEGGMILSGLKADYKAIETYVSNAGQVNCPLIAVGGDNDPIVAISQLSEWKHHTTGGFTSHILHGMGHFYIGNGSNFEVSNDLVANILMKNIDEVSLNVAQSYSPVNMYV